MFDNLDFRFVAVVHYMALAMVVATAVTLLRKTRGHSLLAIAVLALSLQVGAYYWWLPDYVAQGPGRVFEPAFTRMGVALTIYYCISSAMMFAAYLGLPRQREMTYSMPLLRPAIILGTILLMVLFIGYRLRSGAAALVLSEGTDVLGGDAYYNLRAELIDVQTDDNTWLGSHFEHLGRKSLFLLLISSSYFFGRFRNARSLVLVALLSGVLLFDEFIRFQKAPIMFVMAGAFLPAMMFWSRESRLNRLAMVPRWIAGGAFLFGLSAMVAVVTMGVPISEVSEFVKARFFVVPCYTSSWYFYVYPDTNPFVQFTLIRIVATVLGAEPLSYSGAISIDVAEAVSGLRYNANACMVADGWANWGYLGVIVVAIVANMIFIGVDAYIGKIRQRVDVIPLTLFFWTCIVSFGNGAFQNIVIANALWFVPVVYPLIYSQTAMAVEVEPGDSDAQPTPGEVSRKPGDGEPLAQSFGK